MPEEKPRIEQVAEGKIRKKTFGQKISEVFIAESPKNVIKAVFEDHIVPALLDLIVDAFESGVEMTFLKNAKQRRRGRNGTLVAYDQFANGRGGIKTIRSPEKSVYDVLDIVFEDRGQASIALDSLMELISAYDRATVHDFYDACGVTSPNDTSYNDNYYGWTDLRGATVSKVRDGWILNLPEPKQLK